MRIMILQYGDYGDAYRRFGTGGPETYRDQRYSVDFVASLSPKHEVTTVAVCDRHHEEELAPGLRSIGVPLDLVWDRGRLWPLMDRITPDIFICRTPNRTALDWAAKQRVPTLPIFADTFTSNGLRDRLRNWKLGRALGRCIKPCVGNHSLSASQSLTRLGLSPDQIVPWEFRQMEPIGEAKEPPPPGRTFRLFYAGVLSELKGVGDCIEAVALLKSAGADVELTLAGRGNLDEWTAHGRRLGVEASIRPIGLVAAERVLTEMRDHDAVVVPSRHEYQEGLPNTVFEALASRSPLIATDHPSFVNRLRPDVDSLRFKAASPRGLAEQVERLIREPSLYARLSRESASALSGLYVGIPWGELIARFVEDPRCTSGWVKGCSLASRNRSQRISSS